MGYAVNAVPRGLSYNIPQQKKNDIYDEDKNICIPYRVAKSQLALTINLVQSRDFGKTRTWVNDKIP